ncbi:MAG: class I SAM-dependent methyltransferase [Georgenia sp.]
MTENQSAAQHWESRYQEAEAVWSGRPNQVLVTEVSARTPGTALDVGCGEGADSVWLAEQGWRVTGIDISATALDRARRAAEARGVADRIDWQEQDLTTWEPESRYDLVSAQFLHSRMGFPREEVLRRAAGAVTEGGVLLVVGHAGVPPWAEHHAADGDAHDHGGSHDHGSSHGHDPAEVLPTAAGTAAALGLSGPRWELLVSEHRSRTTTGPHGDPAELEDAVVMARRTAVQ